jgi:hypothetical protein
LDWAFEFCNESSEVEDKFCTGTEMNHWCAGYDILARLTNSFLTTANAESRLQFKGFAEGFEE